MDVRRIFPHESIEHKFLTACSLSLRFAKGVEMNDEEDAEGLSVAILCFCG